MKRHFGYLGAVVAVMFLVLQPLVVSAATGSSGLRIMPRKDLTIQPGGSVTDKLTIGNLDGDQDLNLTLRVIDFSFKDQSGTPRLILDESKEPTTWSLKPFLTLPKSVKVPAGESRTIQYTVKIPKNQGAGSYYSAIQYAATDTGGGNVNLAASGVTLAFVSVPGVVQQDLTLKKLGAYNAPKQGLNGGFVFIATNKPDEIGFLLENKGNVVESPAGSITIKPMFGKKTVVIQDINPTSALALRGQTRLFRSCIESEKKPVELGGQIRETTKCKTPSLLPGRYTVNLDIFYGQNGNKTQEITGVASFWYLPWWFIGIVVAVIAALIYVGLKIKRKIQGAVNGVSYQKRRNTRRR